MDLLPEEEKDNVEELKNFSEDNGFNGYFRTSAKTGENIDESMDFLILEVLKRLEDINAKDISNRQSYALDSEKHTKEADAKRKKENSKCC